jgi:dienelactone hydrolase
VPTRREAIGALAALALPVELLRAAPLAASPADPAAPDLGNLHGALEQVARMQAPAFHFLDPRWRSLEEWKAAARPAARRHLGLDTAPASAAGEVRAREVRDGFAVETLRIHAAPGYEIPARLLLPTGRRGPLPAVVALHCHGGQYAWGAAKLVSAADDPPPLIEYRRRLYDGRPVAEVLARRGFVVLAIDAFYFGERRLRPGTLDPAVVPAEARDHHRASAVLSEGSPERIAAENRVAGAFEATVAKSLHSAGATWPGLLAWEDRRSVDYLCSRVEVDPERIGCLGFSLGGLRAVRLAATDARLKAACVTAWMTEMEAMLAHHARRHTWMAQAPGMRAALELPDEAALLAPGALLVQQCARDTLFPVDGMRRAVERLERIYAKAGVPERFRGVFHDEPHAFTRAMQEEAFEWLARWL